MDDDVVEMENYAKLQGVEDVSACTVMKEKIREAGFALISSTGSCLVDKIDRAEDLARDIVDIGQSAIENITAIKLEADECVRDADSLPKIGAALLCVTAAGAKASWVITSQVPAVSLEIAEITTIIATMIPSITFCVPKNAIVTLAEESREVVESIRACINEKIEESKTGTQENSLQNDEDSQSDNEDEGSVNEDLPKDDEDARTEEEHFDHVDNDDDLNSGLLEY